jgi:hypothetical protein
MTRIWVTLTAGSSASTCSASQALAHLSPSPCCFSLWQSTVLTVCGETGTPGQVLNGEMRARGGVGGSSQGQKEVVGRQRSAQVL